MPVPIHATPPGQKPLLRDVVYDKLLEAIQDGTLLPGERLNDAELTAWLGVSRTPVREAIARLTTDGLVEMEANRFTRVANLSAEQHAHAAAFLNGLHRIALDAAPSLDKDTRTGIATTAKGLIAGLQRHDHVALRGIRNAFGDLTLAWGNPLIIEAERKARIRADFHAAAPGAEIDWKQRTEDAKALSRI